MAGPATSASEVGEYVRFAGFALDVAGCTLTGVDGQEISLRRAELALLLAFVRAPGRVLSRDHLLDSVAGRQCAPFDRSIDVLVSRLRHKIEPDREGPRLIVTVPGAGYKFTAKPQRVQATPEHPPQAGIDLARLPDKSSIAVLPFQSMSGDQQQEYFADGLTEEIITALSRIPSFSVIACHSPLAYKGRLVDIREVGRELGVRYVLEGSVRKADERVRICGQLIDTTNGAHLWADRFDRALADILDFQDEVTDQIVGAVDGKLRQVEIEHAVRKPIEALQPHELILRSRYIRERSLRSGLGESRRLMRRAVELDPDNARARASLARCNWLMTSQLLQLPSESELADYLRLARDAVERGRDDPDVLIPAAHIIGCCGDPEEGIALLERALTLNPNSAEALSLAGVICAYGGNTGTALNCLERSIRLNPLHRPLSAQAFGFVVAHTVAGRYEDALAWSERAALDIPSNYLSLRTRAALLGLLGRTEEAQQALRRLLTIVSGLTVSRVRDHIEVVMRSPAPFRRAGFARIVCEGLRMAGLPE